MYTFSLLVISSLLYAKTKGSRCAVGATYSDPDVDKIFTVDIDNGGSIVGEITGFTNRFTSIALDRKTSTVYAIEVDGTGEIYKIDLNTRQQTLIGNVTPRKYNGLYYNCHDDMLYAVDWRGPIFGGNYNVYQINPCTLETKIHGQILGINRQALMVSKDGTKFYLVDTLVQKIYEAPFNNPTTANSVLLAPKIPENINIFSIDWLNTDPNDNTAIICQNSEYTGTESQCFSWDIYTGDRSILFETERIWGLEMIYNFDCNNLPTIGTVMENQCGFTGPYIDVCNPDEGNDDSNDECPCFSNIDSTLEYCLSGCCDVGILMKTKNSNPEIQYGIDFDDKSCFIKQNDIVITQEIGLTYTQYYACENELITASKGYNCTVSDTASKSIFNILSLNTNEESVTLVMLYIIFLALWLCCIIILLRMLWNKLFIYLGFKNKENYQAINVVTVTDTSECP